MKDRVSRACVRVYLAARAKAQIVKDRLCNESGQGTTEYAILVGVLVVIAIAAISLFKPKLEELWNGIVSGMASL